MVSELDILIVTLSLFVELSRSSGTVFTLKVNVAVPPSSDVGPLIGVMVNPGVSSSTLTTKISSTSRLLYFESSVWLSPSIIIEKVWFPSVRLSFTP